MINDKVFYTYTQTQLGTLDAHSKQNNTLLVKSNTV